MYFYRTIKTYETSWHMVACITKNFPGDGDEKSIFTVKITNLDPDVHPDKREVIRLKGRAAEFAMIAFEVTDIFATACQELQNSNNTAGLEYLCSDAPWETDMIRPAFDEYIKEYGKVRQVGIKKYNWENRR